MPKREFNPKGEKQAELVQSMQIGMTPCCTSVTFPQSLSKTPLSQLQDHRHQPELLLTLNAQSFLTVPLNGNETDLQAELGLYHTNNSHWCQMSTAQKRHLRQTERCFPLVQYLVLMTSPPHNLALMQRIQTEVVIVACTCNLNYLRPTQQDCLKNE